MAQMDKIQVYTEAVANDTNVRTVLVADNNSEMTDLVAIGYVAGKSRTFHKIMNKSQKISDFALSMRLITDGSTPGKIKSIFIKGHYVPEN
jgi:hypothetical protein